MARPKLANLEAGDAVIEVRPGRPHLIPFDWSPAVPAGTVATVSGTPTTELYEWDAAAQDWVASADLTLSAVAVSGLQGQLLATATVNEGVYWLAGIAQLSTGQTATAEGAIWVRRRAEPRGS